MIDILSIIEGIYVIYILRYFKTTQSFAMYERGLISGQLTGKMKQYLTHNIHNTDKPMHHICAFGRDASLLLGIFFFLRAYYIHKKISWNWTRNNIALLLVFMGCFLNINAVVYMLPIVLAELYIYQTRENRLLLNKT